MIKRRALNNLELFIPSNNKLITIHDNIFMKEKISQIEGELSEQDKGSMRGYVFAIHETKDGKKELIDFNHNHIVICGRKWLMQRAVGSSMSETPNQHDWTISWFGVGQGGANSSDPLLPLYTPDQQEDLVAPMKIFNTYYTDYVYADEGRKKSFQQINGANAQMKYDNINSEVVALFHLPVEFNDCPYELPNLGASINELALYAAPNNDPTCDEFVMFSRYCLPTKHKSFNDKYTFLWYIYF